MQPQSPRERLRRLLAKPGLLLTPCCYDALSARLIEAAGFPVSFMSGFAVSATRLGLPDAGLISYGEMCSQGRDICAAVQIPVIGDGDTGYGNAVNVKRTVRGYAQAGFAGVTIEDQVWPKRCGHTRGKQVVDRAEALARVKAAVDAREEGADVLILARTDARGTHGLEEALVRLKAFEDLGADLVFMEAPRTVDEMRAACLATSLPSLANMLEDGDSPWLSPSQLEAVGFRLAAYPLTLLNASIGAMQRALGGLKDGSPTPQRLNFEQLQQVVGFTDYDQEQARYAAPPNGDLVTD